MENWNVYKILSYGATGLSCVLLFLAFKLLSAEQEMTAPREEMLTAIYVFLVVASVVCIAGFTAEYVKSKKIAELTKKLELTKKEKEEIATSLGIILNEKNRTTSMDAITSHIRMLQETVDRLKSSDD